MGYQDGGDIFIDIFGDLDYFCYIIYLFSLFSQLFNICYLYYIVFSVEDIVASQVDIFCFYRIKICFYRY